MSKKMTIGGGVAGFSSGIKGGQKRAFTLIELLTVIAIIAILIAILIPALTGTRRSARTVTSQGLLRDIAAASSSYSTDKRREPGYFTPAQMGANDNLTEGFTGIQNVLLDLAGGISRSPANAGDNLYAVGPLNSAAEKVVVDLNQVGVSGAGKGYFTPDRRYLADGTSLRVVADADNNRMFHMVDAFGQPILAWNVDSRQDATAQFVRRTSTGNFFARFFWNSNAGVLSATNLGKEGKDQANGSVIGLNVPDAEKIGDDTNPGSMYGLLASPLSARTKANPADPNERWRPLPTGQRGNLVFQSAGSDGIFLARTDKGMSTHGRTISGVRVLEYKANVDVVKDFDDLVQGNN